MGNIISIQDEYITKVSRYDPTGRTYMTLRTKAARGARRSLVDAGYSDTEARKIVDDAQEVAHHAWMVENFPAGLDPCNESIDVCPECGRPREAK